MIDLASARRFELSPGETAWPTVALFLGALSLQCLAAYLSISGSLSITAAVLASSWCAYAQFTVLHDAAHWSLSKRPWLNESLGAAAALVLFAPFGALRRNHLHHHAHTNDPAEDPDFWVAGENALSIFLRCWTQFTRHYLCYFTKLSRRDTAYREALLTVALLAACVAAAIYHGRALDLALYWFIPSQVASAALAFSFDYWPHRPHRNQGRLRDTAVIAPRGFDWLFLNQNIHLIHHLFPTIPWYRYRAAFTRLEPGIRAEGGIIWDFSTALRQLRPGG